MERINNSGKTAIWATLASLVTVLIGVVVRMAFLKYLSETYLGLTSLFSSVIGVMSFADLGLSAAFTCCLYKPIANNEIEHIAAILQEIKKVYRYVVVAVTAVGVCLLPFLRVIVSGADEVSDSNLIIYYLIALCNLICSYFLAHRTTYVFAKQKSYLLAKIDIAFSLIMSVAQLLAVVLCKSYILYLFVGLAITILQRVVTGRYIDKKFPEVKKVATEKFREEDKEMIRRNVKAAVIGKFGGICVSQVDTILISSGINISTTGFMSNYLLIKTTICTIITNIQNSITAGMGDVVSSESKSVQMNVFNTYMMFNSWMIGFAMCGIGVLSTPLIAIVFGDNATVDGLSVFLYSTAMYFSYQTYALNVLPTVGGRLDVTEHFPLIEGLSNIVISVAGLKLFGLAGIFVGTLGSQVINYILRPIAIFRKQFNTSPLPYFKQTGLYFLVNMGTYLLLLLISRLLFSEGYGIVSFCVMCLTVVVVYAAIQFVVWRKSEYFLTAFTICKNYILKTVLKRQ